jgi:RimJ/RimL family protein N-acetyltransferase
MGVNKKRPFTRLTNALNMPVAFALPLANNRCLHTWFVPTRNRKFKTMEILTTERLRLRHLQAGDAGFMLSLLNEPAYHRFIGDKGVRTLDGARDFIRDKIAASYANNGFGLYLVELKAAATPLGICGLVKREGLDDIDIGFAFREAFWSKGYAFEAASATMDYARDTVGLKRIVAITALDNISSITLLEKLGLKFERIIRIPGNERDSRLFVKPFFVQ